MRRRWSDAQYTGRYLRRTIVHGKGESRKHTASGGSGGSDVGFVIGLIIKIILLIALFVWNTTFGLIALLLLLIFRF